MLLGDGSGALEYAGRYSDDVSSDVVAQDLDGDGDADVAATVDNGMEVRVYRGDGNGLLSDPVAYPVSGFPQGLAATDLDGDSDPDLIVGNGSSSSVAVLRNDGSAGFADQQDFPTGVISPRDLVAADFDRDGAPDVAVVSGSVSSVRVLAGLGDGRLAPGQELHDHRDGRRRPATGHVRRRRDLRTRGERHAARRERQRPAYRRER